MSLLHKKYTMNKTDASSTLQNVLDACDKSTQTPIDEILQSRVEASKGYNIYLIAVSIILALTLLTPLAFIPFATSGSAPNYKPDIKVDEYHVENGMLYIDLGGSFIDYTSIYAVTATGTTVFPSEYNSGTGLVSFIYDETEWNIFVSDLNDVTVHMLLTPES